MANLLRSTGLDLGEPNRFSPEGRQGFGIASQELSAKS